MDSKLETQKKLGIVLMGKTGVGKSASGNIILGKDSFKEDKSSSSTTEKCSTETREFNGQELIVTDTPGLYNTKKNLKETMREIVEFIELILLEHHVFLWVVKQGRYINEDAQSMKAFKEVFPTAAKHTMVLFTHGDNEKVNKFIYSKSVLEEFIKWSGNKYHVFNKTWEGDDQVLKLIEKINNIPKEKEGLNKGGLIEQAKKAIEKLENQPVEPPSSDSKEGETSFLKEVIDGMNDLCPVVKPVLQVCVTATEKCIKKCSGEKD